MTRIRLRWWIVSMQWSFLQGKRVWTSGGYTAFVEPCVTDMPGRKLSAGCRDYLAREPKAAQQWRLEERLAAFEGQSH